MVTSTPELVSEGPSGVEGVRDQNGVVLRFPQFQAVPYTLSTPQRANSMGVSEDGRWLEVVFICNT